MPTKRLLLMSDPHAGSKVGLTPPEWWYDDTFKDSPNYTLAKHQRELWNWHDKTLKTIRKQRKINMVVNVGDLVDGKGKRSGGSEQYTSDMNEQAEMGAAILDSVKANEVGIIFGTPYHTGQEDDWEEVAASKVKTPVAFVSGQEWLKFNNCTFDLKHKVGGSQIPHGRFTAVARSKLWNTVWASDGKQPDADVLVRGHVHYHAFCGDTRYLAMTLPGLQGFGSKYGVRQCEGKIDIGMVVFDVNPDGSYSWTPYIANLPQQTAHPVVR